MKRLRMQWKSGMGRHKLITVSTRSAADSNVIGLLFHQVGSQYNEFDDIGLLNLDSGTLFDM